MRPHLEHGMPACSLNLVADINDLERIRRLTTRLVTGMRHLPYEGGLQRLGLHSLQWRRLRADLITASQIFKGLLDIHPNLFFLPPARCGLRGHPFKVFKGAIHRRRRGLAFSARVVEYWNKLPVIISICHPTPCFIYVVSSGPLWPTYCPIINHNHVFCEIVILLVL